MGLLLINFTWLSFSLLETRIWWQCLILSWCWASDWSVRADSQTPAHWQCIVFRLFPQLHLMICSVILREGRERRHTVGLVLPCSQHRAAWGLNAEELFVPRLSGASRIRVRSVPQELVLPHHHWGPGAHRPQQGAQLTLGHKDLGKVGKYKMVYPPQWWWIGSLLVILRLNRFEGVECIGKVLSFFAFVLFLNKSVLIC